MSLIVTEFKITLPLSSSLTLCVFCLSVSIVPELYLSHCASSPSLYLPGGVISTKLVFSK